MLGFGVHPILSNPLKGLFGCEAQKYQGSIPLWGFLRDARDPLSSWGDSLHSLLSFGWTGKRAVHYALDIFFLSFSVLYWMPIFCPVQLSFVQLIHLSIKNAALQRFLKKYKRQF
jgi:hypothetical protein